MTMKSKLLLLLLVFAYSAQAQRTIILRNMWTVPKVKVLFQGYTLLFSVKDIDKTLGFLAETGDTVYGTSSYLDTAQYYSCELFPNGHIQYGNRLQPLLQNGVGAFLLLSGHAAVFNKKHKRIMKVTANISEAAYNEPYVLITFYDPKNQKILFYGKMRTDIYNRDLGIDD